MTALDVARNFTRRGLCVVPVPFRTKAPVIRGWQKLRLDAASLPKYFNGQPQNIGVLLGEPSGWLVDVDLDHRLTVELGPLFLPETGAIFGRSGKPRSHFLYRASGPIKTKKYERKTGPETSEMLVELRSTGGQTVFPGSVHVSGELIQWAVEDEPATVDPDALYDAVKRLAETVLAELGGHFDGENSGDSAKGSKLQPGARGGQRLDDTPDRERVLSALGALHSSRADSRADWISVGMSLHSFDPSLLREWDRWSQQSAKYKPGEPEKKWASFNGSGITVRTLFMLAIKDGWRPRRQRAAGSGSGANKKKPSTDSPGCPALGERDPESDRLVLSATKTLPTAEAFIDEFHRHDDGTRTLYSYSGTFMEWRQNHYAEVENESLKQRLLPWLHGALRPNYNKLTGQFELIGFEANPRTVNSAFDSLRAYSHLPADISIPAWLDGGAANPPADEMLVGPQKLWHLGTMRSMPHTPRFFATHSVEFEPNPEAPEPDRLLSFLDDIVGDDDLALDLIQEWFGYCLVSDTSLQKMLLIIGPRRSGKGTIARALTRLLGSHGVCGPTTSSLAGPFGLQQLIGKTLAIVSDARFHGENIPTVVERLLCISGEDFLTIDRKYLPSVSMKLPTRFMFLSNEAPRLTDASGALAGRFMLVRMTKSFYGQEDPRLTDKICEQLPGILNWAITGWKRLKNRGHFVQPQSVQDLVRQIEDLSSPVGAFVRDYCEVGPGHRVDVDVLFACWKHWCEQEGRNIVGTRQSFGRDLAAAVPGVSRKRGTGNVPFYEGIQVAEAREWNE